MRGDTMGAKPAQSTLSHALRPAPPMPLTIEHLPQRHCFQAIVDGQRCVVDYQLSGKVLTITHTYVPPALEGRGIAARLTRAVLDHARAQHLKVAAACSYARAYMRRRPETLDLLA
jgi:predicted GNAT family acetyltransferase